MPATRMQGKDYLLHPRPLVPSAVRPFPQKDAILAPCSSKIVTVAGDAGHGGNRDAGLK